MNDHLALELLKFIRAKLDERMEYAKKHNSDQRAVNIAGFCAELKRDIGQEKARIVGKL